MWHRAAARIGDSHERSPTDIFHQHAPGMRLGV